MIFWILWFLFSGVAFLCAALFLNRYFIMGKTYIREDIMDTLNRYHVKYNKEKEKD